MKMRVLLLFLALRPCCGALAAPMLTHAWRVEATRPAETSVVVRQGETLRLECSLLERAKPIHPPEDASSRFFWRDAEAKGDWWSAPASRTDNTLAFDWTPAQDPGARRYDFVLSLESPSAGTLYRAAGLLVMQPSPGFNPAELAPPDVRQELIDDITADVKGWADATYQPKGDYLTAEADPTVPAWAKAAAKPAYTAAEVGAAQASHTHDGRYFRLDGSSIMLKGSGNGPYGWALGRIAKGEVTGGWGIRFSEVDLNNYTSYDSENALGVAKDASTTYCAADGSVYGFKVPVLTRHAYEKKSFTTLYPEYKGWFESNGASNTDWYLHPDKSTNFLCCWW